MKSCIRSLAAALLAMLLVTVPTLPAAAGEAARTAASIKVRVDKPGVKVSPTLWGIFYEEINCSGDGGLYAEMVRNRSFEDAEKPDNWTLVQEGGCEAEMSVVKKEPAGEFNRRALRLEIRKGGSGRAGAANGGWWGMGVKAGEACALTVIARAGEGFEGPLGVTIEGAEGKVLATGSIEGLSSQWKRISLDLVPSATDPKARLVLAAARPGTVWLDFVSLFPERTWKERPNGLRPDLAEMLDGLKPAFARFPGGCWVEGDTLEFAQRWKQTIGDVAERRSQYNIWQYMATNGLAYHEYLQMSEDLKAEPLFVINCGMSHRENVPMDQMGPWVQDALDAIEYANGPADSKWGSLRAESGHPAPFGLKLLEIGNENGGPAYQERYALFHDAIKARYPEIQLIANVPTDRRKADIVDEHYYSSPGFFMSQADRYDGYDRKGPKIFVGEYAVTQGCGQGNLRGALGEAAFMTGMERNSDVVVLAAYAPLFVNINHKRWNPDLINFDSSRVYGIPSYHVQKMFAENRVDAILPLEQVIRTGEEPGRARPGAIGLGTWATQAEFKDIQVTQGGKSLFACDFSKGTQGWKVYKGDWTAQDKVLKQSFGGDDLRITAGDPAWHDYTYSLKARKIFGAEGFLVMFQVRDEANWLWWNLGGWGNSRHAIENSVGGGKSILGSQAPGKIETGRWYDIRIELEGNRVKCFLDGALIHDARFPEPRPLYAVAGRAGAAGEVVLKVVNVSPEAIETRIDLEGAGKVESKAKAVVLTSADPMDENTIDQGAKVSPVEREVDTAAAGFTHSFPANSLTVLRIKAEGARVR